MLNLNVSVIRGDKTVFTLTVFRDLTLAQKKEISDLAKLEGVSFQFYFVEHFSELLSAGKIQIVDITGCSFIMTVRKGLRSSILFQLSTSTGEIVLTNPTGGQLEITIASAKTSSFINSSFDYVYDIEMFAIGETDPETICMGNFTVSSDVTYGDT